MAIKLLRFTTIEEFYARTHTYLKQSPAEHNLLLGLLWTLQHCPDIYPEAPYLVSVEAETEVVAVALETPPYKLLISKVNDLAALNLIAEDRYRYQLRLPGVSSLVTEVQTFVQTWQRLTGQHSQLAMAMRIHQLQQVNPVSVANGALRRANDRDRPLLQHWCQDFVAEAIPQLGVDPERMLNQQLSQGLYLWEDDRPVSFACGYPFLPTAARVGPVYTPPEYRRRGYATACVAALSQQLLDQNCQHCFLFTDLANPTSNHIYQAIGYHPICAWEDYSFVNES